MSVVNLPPIKGAKKTKSNYNELPDNSMEETANMSVVVDPKKKSVKTG